MNSTITIRNDSANGQDQILFGGKHVAWINTGGEIGGARGGVSQSHPMFQDVCLTPGGESHYTYLNAIPHCVMGGDEKIPLETAITGGKVIVTAAGVDAAGWFRYQARTTFETDPDRAGQIRIIQSFDLTLQKNVDARDVRDGKGSTPPGIGFQQVRGMGPCWLIELNDPFIANARGPATEISADFPYRVPYAGNDVFTRRWHKAYDTFVFESVDGTTKVLPLAHERLNHSSGRYAQVLKSGHAQVGYGVRSGGNPMHLLESNDRILAGICNWIYDQHIIIAIPFEAPRELWEHAHRVNHFIALPEQFVGDGVILKAGRNIRLNWTMFAASEREAAAMLERAIPVEIDEPDRLSFTNMPALEATANSFQTPVADIPDANGWRPASQCVWDREAGYRRAGSLRISNGPHSVEGAWVAAGGRSRFCEPNIPGRKYRLSARVRTIYAQGEGAWIELHFVRYANLGGVGEKVAEQFECRTPAATGNQHWILLEAEVGPFPEDCSSVDWVARLRGPGTAWFDEVTFEPA